MTTICLEHLSPQPPPRVDQARVLDHTLRLLSRTDLMIDRALGKGLARLCGGGGLMKLGFANLDQYVAQRLGIGTRHAYDLRMVEERLAARPVVERAYDAGRLTYSHVLLLLTKVAAADDAEWVELACRLSVRGLRDALARRKEPPLASSEAESFEELLDGRRGRYITLELTRSEAARLQVALELASRQCGANLSMTDALEIFLAEFLAGQGGAALAAVDGASLDARVPDAEVEAEAEARRHARSRRRRAQMERDLEALTHHWSALAWEPLPPLRAVEMPAVTDAYELDCHMRKILALRQRLHAHFMQLLQDFATLEFFRTLGFASMRHYLVERLGMALRTANALLQLNNDLFHLPQVAHAYRGGEITQTQAQLVAQVATTATQRKWIKFARTHTTRWLEEAVRAERGRDICGQMSASSAEPVDDVPAFQRTPLAWAMRLDERMFATVVPDDGDDGSSIDLDDHDVDPIVATVRVWIPVEMEALWLRGQEACRLLLDADYVFADECMREFIDAYLEEWADEARRVMREHPILTRDAWVCAVPTCHRRVHLHVHHIRFRSAGGGDESRNLVTLCEFHHLRGIHEGCIEVSGRAPDRLLWRLGLHRERPPLLVARGDGLIMSPAPLYG